jgi:hypothetical protein
MPDYRMMIAQLREEQTEIGNVIEGLERLVGLQQPQPANVLHIAKGRNRKRGSKGHSPATRTAMSERWAQRRDRYNKAKADGFEGSLKEYEKTLQTPAQGQ